MEEQIITYETAILAQDKGFKGYYKYRYTDFNGIIRIEKERSEIFAPALTQSLLQKWLREKHNIDLHAQPFIMTNNSEGYYLPDESYSYFLFKDGIFITNENDFLDFEDALEHGLQKALQLIK